MMRRFLIVCVVALGLCGCVVQSEVQGDYVSAKATCQAVAATSVEGANVARSSRNQALKSAFGACMGKNGFQLTTAKAPPTRAQPQPDPIAARQVPNQTSATQTPVTLAQPQPDPIATRAAQQTNPVVYQAPVTTAAPTPTGAQAPLVQPPTTLPAGAATYQPMPARNFNTAP